MKAMLLSNKKLLRTSVLVFCVLVTCLSVFLMASAAENEVIHAISDPLLEKQAIGDGDPWQAVTTFSQDQMSANNRRLYDIKTNSYVLWWDQDDFDYFYTPYYFGYGRKAKMTIETTVNSWDMPMPTASAGIALRSGLGASAATAFLHVRENHGVTIIYRASDGDAEYGPVYYTDSANVFPIRLKMEVQGNKAKCFYAINGSADYVEMPGSYTFNYTDSVMVGLGVHSSDEQKSGHAIFEGLDISIEAPAGTKYLEYGAQGGGEGPTQPQVQLPEDFPVTEDVLFMETFTDGSMVQGTEAITNPIWDNNNPKLDENIQLDEAARNRYLLLDGETDYWYFAGNQKMSDYSLDMDVTFSEESIPVQVNQFRVYVRHRYSPMTGHYYYYVDFTWDAEKQEGTVKIAKGYHNSDPIKGTYPGYTQTQPYRDALSNGEGDAAVYRFDYMRQENLGKAGKLRIDAFDNKITVYWNGEEIAYGEDLDDGKFFNGFGNVGLYSNNAMVLIDNICVRKVEDHVGGEYDNSIGGRFDEPIPEYLEDYVENGWEY